MCGRRASSLIVGKRDEESGATTLAGATLDIPGVAATPATGSGIKAVASELGAVLGTRLVASELGAVLGTRLPPDETPRERGRGATGCHAKRNEQEAVGNADGGTENGERG